MPGMEDCRHAGVRPGMAVRETDSELGLRTAGGGGLRTRQTGRVNLPGLAVLHSPARRGYRAHPGADRRDGPVLREADMTAFAEPGAYQAIIIPAGSIMLLDGRAAVPRALAAFRESLSPGGRLIL